MTGDLLLDTNIVVALFAADPAVLAKIANTASVYICATVLGELCYGAEKSGRPQQNLQHVIEFADSVTILPSDRATALQYGTVKNRLRSLGRPIPENDIWIAATALQHGLTLATRDKHFSHVQGLATDECR